MLYLSIESSCDETSLALLEGQLELRSVTNKNFLERLNSFRVIGSVISSQIATHAPYGGVVPEIGARQHADQIHWLFKQVLNQAHGLQDSDLQSTVLSEADWHILNEIETIFVTTEPGLASALRVGLEFAKTLQFFVSQKTNRTIAIQPVNHLRGHVASSFYQVFPDKIFDSNQSQTVFPHLHLLVSGGNSQLLWFESWHTWKIIGQKLDDAAGECLDKVGRMLGLPHPGGVYVSRIAKLHKANLLKLPVGMKKSTSLDYSFSGTKTAIRYLIQKQEIPDLAFEKALSSEEVAKLTNASEQNYLTLTPKLRFVYEVCVSAQTVVMEQLTDKTRKAIQELNPISLGLSGGVSASPLLRQEMNQIVEKNPLLDTLYLAPLQLTGDNAVMIGLAGLAEQFSA